jgi:tetraacyldisaccharide 4'-kinase
VNPNLERRFLDVISGRATGAGASLLRGALRAAEPFYSGVARARNALFDKGIKTVRRLDRPVISIGNITTGGAGKTPMVRWLAERLRDEGTTVAILSRGYRAEGNSAGDELTMLDRALNRPGTRPVFVKADPNRFAGGTSLLREHPEIDAFLLDDGFQHRRLHRDFDLALISALEPFGYSHVLPRGLLREPQAGLNRASAVVLTHADQVDNQRRAEIESGIRKHSDAPIYRAVHAEAGLLSPEAYSDRKPISHLTERRFFAFCGLANPTSLDRRLQSFGNHYVGQQWFGDHHQYTPADIKKLVREARDRGAELLLTTEKDWVKIEKFAVDFPIWRLAIRMQFVADDENRLLAQIHSAITGKSAQ